MGQELKKISSTAFILIGIYYMLVGLRVINAKIIWLKESLPAPANMVITIAIILIIVGLLLRKDFMRKLKDVF